VQVCGRLAKIPNKIERQYPLALGYDVSLPIAAMERYIAQACGPRLRGGSTGAEARCWVYGHLGDGNLHLNVWAPNFVDTGQVAAIVYSGLQAVGGSISAEHGVGLEKKAYLLLSRTAQEIATMRRIKQALDPHAILNPGKIFDRSAYARAMKLLRSRSSPIALLGPQSSCSSRDASCATSRCRRPGSRFPLAKFLCHGPAAHLARGARSQGGSDRRHTAMADSRRRRRLFYPLPAAGPAGSRPVRWHAVPLELARTCGTQRAGPGHSRRS
jgi:hypothetical protein